MITTAQPATVQFSDCFSSPNISQKLDVSTVYAQYFPKSSNGPYINFTVIGTSPQQIVSASNGTNPVATTLFTTTEVLTFPQPNNHGNSFFCATLRPASPLPEADPSGSFCPLDPGPFAFSSSVQVQPGSALLTLDTRLRALDPFQTELLCLDVNTTILDPSSGGPDSVYGHANIIFWSTVGLAIGYWVVVGIARLVAAWGRGSSRGGNGFLARVEGAGFVLASALSGERFASSPALMRFCTPSLRDIVFHTQWCAVLSMVAVQWPMFTYPLLSQTAWATLSYNISLTQGKNADHLRWNPLTVQPYNPPSNFADQLDDPSSPIFIDSSAPNFLFQLPPNATTGMSAFAWSVGLRPQDLFGICVSIFLAIVAATIVLSVLVWALDFFMSLIAGAAGGGAPTPTGLGGTRSPRYSSASKDMLDGIGMSTTDENRSLNGHFLFSRSTSRFPNTRAWWRWRSNFVSFHGSALHGNLVRLLVLFHLPITVFSCYHMSLPRSQASVGSVVLAALSFVFLSVLIPAFLVFRLTTTRTSKLYDETWTLLSLGPLYNHYRHGSQLFACTLFAINIAFGVTIGFGQKSGTAQAIVILVVEVASALGTSVWLPWGQGASMGLISFLFCVGRIVIAVLLVILTPVVSIGAGAAQWVAYAILFILGLIYLAFLLMLIVKIVEAILRIAGGIGFARSRHVVDSGLLGTLGLMGCCGPRHPHRNGGYRPAVDRPPSTLALPRPMPLYKNSTPPSSGPPSVLRPEHAMQPYKEDSDDETGFIMGAWQPFPGPGMSQVEEQAPPEPPKSGFARVAGGRAHYDSPYAIASGSATTFPSERNRGPGSFAKSTPSVVQDSPPPTPSIASAARGLPPGAMPPAHVRTKSQTAIIESAPFMAAQAATVAGGSGGALSGHQADAVAALAAEPQPKKKYWYSRKKNRRMSESDAPLSDPVPVSQESGRSFVVMRKPRPGMPSPSQGSSASQPLEGADEQGRRSFSVLRGTSHSDPQTPAAS
ncbi:hypothetical protein BD311DRAFT_652998 [Dichomitus squalens]|uniref:TRP C-terminal domain-containing protein n=1 Tax=Dichomitus squalens TaxID=114155 RepID=A0A4Q9MYA2_9APHY|nr:hypothetical protein BD311DRAFT_652998 [Dichomitus squalens]